MELYLHIPFCIKKCQYCDFLSAPADDETQARYFRALQKQICLWGIREQQRAGGPRRVDTIFIGGGTPSVWDGERISDLMDMVKASFDISPEAEITIEANPGTLTEEKLLAYRRAGINRLSMGLQTSDDVLLKVLGRIHTWGEFTENYAAARKAGFTNINVDLMSGLPGQTLKNYEETLRKVLALEPEHISAYSLIIEEGTPFYEMTLALPDEDTERAMYHRTKETLAEHGYQRYEISNYAKPGFESRHNLGYWSGVEYLGLGLGASSLDEDTRYRICPDLKSYLEILEGDESDSRVVAQLMMEVQPLTEREKMEEFCFLGLRKTEGISRRAFKAQFGKSLDIVYEDVIHKYRMLELLDSDGDRLFLTDRGMDVSNTVMCEFLLEEEEE